MVSVIVGFVIIMWLFTHYFLADPGFDQSPSEDERLAEAQLHQNGKCHQFFFLNSLEIFSADVRGARKKSKSKKSCEYVYVLCHPCSLVCSSPKTEGRKCRRRL
jgi:hypothetical protein